MGITRKWNAWMLGFALAGLCGFAAAQSSSTPASSAPMSHSQMSGASASSNLSPTDKRFAMEAAQGGRAEVELGKLAEQKASNPEVKQFAERMVHDHTQADAQLKQVAAQTGIALPVSLSSKDEALKEKLSGLSGEQFDKTYMQNMVLDHTKDISEFKHESADGKDSAVKNFASETLPTLESHLKEARHIEPMVAQNGPMSKG
ncbi:MAG TPA: DUF4142 domain-containing protein [Verrucomicrobiae bacterium]|nr:DUF4142 domain-containing protein [Verrucomicrobiae bacterium]